MVEITTWRGFEKYCKGRIKVKDDLIIHQVVSPHEHNGDPLLAMRDKFDNKIREGALASRDDPQIVAAEALEDVDPGMLTFAFFW